MSVEEQEQRLRQIQRQYVGFLDDGEADGVYEKNVGDMIKEKKNRLLVNIIFELFQQYMYINLDII